MDEMRVKGILFSSLVEVLIKRWVKKRTGAALDISLQSLDFDLSGDDYKLALSASGRLTKEDKKKIIDAINPFSKGIGA